MKKTIVFLMFFLPALLAKAEPEPVSEPAPAATVVELPAQKTLSGVVYDMDSAETLAGVSITANGQKVYTDLDGRFCLDNLCEGTCTLTVSLISYQEQTLEIDLDKTGTLDIKLAQR